MTHPGNSSHSQHYRMATRAIATVIGLKEAIVHFNKRAKEVIDNNVMPAFDQQVQEAIDAHALLKSAMDEMDTAAGLVQLAEGNLKTILGRLE